MNHDALDGTSKAAYANSTLSDEGAATLENIKAEREIMAHGGQDIQIAGNSANAASYNKAYDQLQKDGNVAKARQTIGNIFGKGEITSNTNEPYATYYGKAYDKAHPAHPAPVAPAPTLRRPSPKKKSAGNTAPTSYRQPNLMASGAPVAATTMADANGEASGGASHKGTASALETKGAKVPPAKAANVIAALPKLDGKPYGAGIDYEHGKNMDVVPEKLVCNEYVYHAYRMAGENLPASREAQIDYFKQSNRLTTDMSKGEVGDVAFFNGAQGHEAIVKDVKEIHGTKWYQFSGAKGTGKESGELTSKQGEPVYLRQDGHPASLRGDDLVIWKENAVEGFTQFVGFGKAGK